MLELKDYIADWEDFDFPNFRYWLDNSLNRWPERIALRYRAEKRDAFDQWSYARLGSEAKTMAAMLLDGGLCKGDRVAIWAENRPEWCATWLATVISGGVVVPMDSSVSEDEAAGILKACEPKFLFISRAKSQCLTRFYAECPSIDRGVVYPRGSAPYEPEPQGAEKGDPRTVAYLELAGRAWGSSLPAPESISPGDCASIIFTSGTTGLSKGVMLSHHGIIANANASILSLPIYESDVFMSVLPLHHTYPTTCCFISPLTVGASITICEKVIGKVILADAKDSGGSILIGVPLLYDKLMAGLRQNFAKQSPLASRLITWLFSLSGLFRKIGLDGFGRLAFSAIRAKAGLGTIRLMVAGGGPLNPRTADFFNDFGICSVQGYGMSENGPLITTNTMKYKDSASAGLRVKYTDLRILEAASDGVGEIAVRSPSLMLGYYKNPKASADAMTPDGWLKTGDLGYLDSRGFLFITGRLKNLIVSAGGKNIFPEEIEAKFEQSRIVAEVLVLGRRRAAEDLAELIVAVCVPNYEALAQDFPGKELDESALRRLVEGEVERINRLLPPYKKISKTELRTEEFEKTSSKKVKRYLYLKEYA